MDIGENVNNMYSRNAKRPERKDYYRDMMRREKEAYIGVLDAEGRKIA